MDKWHLSRSGTHEHSFPKLNADCTVHTIIVWEDTVPCFLKMPMRKVNSEDDTLKFHILSETVQSGFSMPAISNNEIIISIFH